MNNYISLIKAYQSQITQLEKEYQDFLKLDKVLLLEKSTLIDVKTKKDRKIDDLKKLIIHYHKLLGIKTLKI